MIRKSRWWLAVLWCCLPTALAQQLAPARAPTPGSPVEIRAHRQTRDGTHRLAEGDVELLYRSIVLTADKLAYDESSGEIEAVGNVH